MPNVTPQAVVFSNERVRPLAEEMVSLYWTCKSFVAQWTAQGIATAIPNDANVVTDGASVDGRPQITNAQINILFAHASSFIAYCEGATSAPVNNASKQNLNQMLALTTKGQSRF